MAKKYILYFDDTGSRNPDHHIVRDDGLDCFGLGGVLVKEEDVDEIFEKHKSFCDEWGIDYPLHSYQIRGGRGKFGWLKNPEKAASFLPAIEDFLLSLPIIGIACVIDRPGYVARYKDRHDRLWLMAKMAFCVLVERAAKFVDSEGRRLEIYFEVTGKREDGDIVQYLKDLKREGNPFNPQTSDGYDPLTNEDYRRIILGEPRQKTKKSPIIQIADLVLYPMAKGGYDPEYRPFIKLKEGRKLIDCFLEEDEIPLNGIKYSCFDEKK